MDTEFGMHLKSGLAICRACPEGRVFAETVIPDRSKYLGQNAFRFLRKRDSLSNPHQKEKPAVKQGSIPPISSGT